MSLVLARELVTPHRRLIKVSVAAALLTLMFRFDMIYSLYLFIFLFPFPSAIYLGSTNSILVTLIVLIWFIRSHSERQRFFPKTEIDKFVLLLFGAYIVSLFNVDTFQGIKQGLTITWRQVSAFAFFYLIVRFVTDEEKLVRITKIIAFATGLVFLTGVIELFFPGAAIIPGWIHLGKRLGMGMLKYRVEGIRLGGAVTSHGMLADFATVTLFFIAYYFIRAKNPFSKFVWTTIGFVTFVVMLATANRGAFFGFILGVVYFLYLFRKKISIIKYVSFLVIFLGLFALGQTFLEKYTVAASITQRIRGTQFKGVVPETRVGTWKPALVKSTEHILIGHGPAYEHGRHGTPERWPHNGYIFYLYTVGLVGLSAFLVIVYRIAKLSLSFKGKSIWETNLGNLAAILHIQLVMLLFEQLRTDHQRDNIYIYFIWMIFGLIVAASRIIRKREEEEGREEEPAPVPST